MKTLNLSNKLAARQRAGFTAALFLLASLLAAVTPVRADNPPTYLFSINSNAVPGGSFSPDYVAADGSNNVYVTGDNINVTGGNGIQKFTSNGNYLAQWSSGKYGAITVDGSNDVYVDESYSGVARFDSNGNYLPGWGTGSGQFDNPVGIAVDGSNNVYVVDYENSRVQKFDSNGNEITLWGSGGRGNGQFSQPLGIAVDSSNNVYVVDGGNSRVEKFTGTGSYLTQWGSHGTGNGQFQAPNGIAVDSSDNVYVVDSLNSRIEKFTGTGNYLTQWGSLGSGNGMFKNPMGIAVDSTGNFVYVADSGNSRVEVFSNSIPAILPIPLNISLAGTQAVLRWSNAAFSLQSASALTGPWTVVSSATSPYTNDINSSQLFFRLEQ